MDIELRTVVVTCAIFVVLWGWRVLNWIWFTPKKLEKCLTQQGLKGNPYRLLHGDAKESSLMVKKALSKPLLSFSDDIVPYVIPLVHQTIKKYGKDSFMWFGWTPRVLIMEPDLVREVFVKYNNYRKIEPNPLVKMFVNGLASYNGEVWAKHRKLINPAFHIDKLKHMLPSFHLSCSETISKWEKMVSTDGSFMLDVWPYLETLTSDAISRTSFGSSYEEGKKIFHLLKESGELAMQALQSIYIPGWKYLPTKNNKRMKEIAKEMKALVRIIIDNKMNAMKVGEHSNGDLLSILVESNLSEIMQHGSKSASMSIQEVIEECKQFYLVGQETTSVMLGWTMFLLSIHPNWQERAREEVLQVFGNEKPHFEGLNQLKIVNMIFYEVLRLYPPGVIHFRTIHEETTLGNISLKPGVQVALPILALHRDKMIWGDDANEFNPKRFCDGLAMVTRNRFPFFPFGWGPRICIGQNFAMVEAKIIIAMILQRFSFDLSSSHVHAPQHVLTLQPRDGVQLIMHKL